MVKLVAQTWGNSEAQLRSVSLVASTLSLVAIWALARQWLGWAGTVFVVCVTAFAPMQVYYARELREYSLTFLLDTLLLLCLHTMLRDWRNPFRWIIYTVVSAAAIALQFGLWIAVALAQAVYFAAMVRSRSRTCLLQFASSSTCLLATVAVVYWSSLRGRVTGGDFAFSYLDHFYLSNRTFPGFVHDLADLSRSFLSFAVVSGPLAVSLSGVLLLAGIVAAVSEGGNRRLTLVYFAAPIIPVIALSIGRLYPFGGVRQDMFLFPMLYVVLGAGFEYIARRLAVVRSLRRRPAALALISAPCAFALLLGWRAHQLEYWPLQGENLRPVLAQMADRVQPGDKVYVYWAAAPAFRYYWEARGLGAGHPDTAIVWGRFRTEDAELYRADIDAAFGSSRRLWVVFSHTRDDALSDQQTVIPWLESRSVELDRVTAGVGERTNKDFVDPVAYLFARNPGAANP
jgi:hypothetical protein